MCWRAKGKHKSLTQAKFALYIRKIALSQVEMLHFSSLFAGFGQPKALSQHLAAGPRAVVPLYKDQIPSLLAAQR